MNVQIQSIAPFFHIILAFFLVFRAAISDFRNYKIPNNLTFPMMACGMLWHSFSPFGKGFDFSLLGLCVGFLTMLPFFASGGMGAGDLKIMMALGALLGSVLVFAVFIASSVICGVYVIVWAFCTGQIVLTFKRFSSLLKKSINSGSFEMSKKQVEPVKYQGGVASQKLIPFGVMVASGMVLVFGMGMAFIVK